MIQIDIEKTENAIKAKVEELLNEGFSFSLEAHPADLDDRGRTNVRQKRNVIIRFKSIDYDSNRINPQAKCFARQNTVNFSILVNDNNLRQHEVAYQITQAIIGKLRGTCVAQEVNDQPIQQSPVYFSSAEYLQYEKTKSCNKMSLTLSFDYVEAYSKQA